MKTSATARPVNNAPMMTMMIPTAIAPPPLPDAVIMPRPLIQPLQHRDTMHTKLASANKGQKQGNGCKSLSSTQLQYQNILSLSFMLFNDTWSQ